MVSLWQRIEAAEHRQLRELEYEVHLYLFGAPTPHKPFHGDNAGPVFGVRPIKLTRPFGYPAYLKDMNVAQRFWGDFRKLELINGRFVATVGSAASTGGNPAEAIMAARIKNDLSR